MKLRGYRGTFGFLIAISAPTFPAGFVLFANEPIIIGVISGLLVSLFWSVFMAALFKRADTKLCDTEAAEFERSMVHIMARLHCGLAHQVGGTKTFKGS